MSTTAAALTLGDVPANQHPAVRTINSWRRFHHRVRKQPAPLLAGLSRYTHCVFVAGCQRSGTTMLTRILAGSSGFRSFRFTHDDELDAALALAGRIDLPSEFRYCFQTTYLNERYTEYKKLSPEHRLIWVIRNPYSVVYSMVYHWRRFALNELYDGCVRDAPELAGEVRHRRLPWPFTLATLERACIAYAWKTAQVNAIRKLLQPNQLMLLDYDELVRFPAKWLPRVFAFVGENYEAVYASGIRTNSLHKADRLSARERELVARIAEPVYQQCKALTSAQ